MTQGFFQFNNIIINEIRNFATSTSDLLFMSGENGNSKSETIEKIVSELQQDYLVLQHFCFKNTVINDFLLNFYDALRNFTLMQKVSVKKFSTDNFKEKVSHYFKTISANCIIIVENFEKIEENIEIVDFLSHLASYKNVKIIVVSSNSDKNLFRLKKINLQTIKIQEIDKKEFKSKLTILANPIEDNVKEKFYEITKGRELYLNMAIKYSMTTNVEIGDLIEEFLRHRNNNYMNFEEFLVTKFISLIPNVYKNLLNILAILSHPVNKEFLLTYKLGDISNIDYLSKNYLISKFRKGFYVKDYFKQYIIKTFSIQDKVSYYKKLVEIYENELTKSPKDRLIRLSRESIRKEISYLEENIPSIKYLNKGKGGFSYLSLTNKNWTDEKEIQKEKLSEKLKKIKERKNILLSNKEEEKQLIKKQESIIDKEEREERNRYIANLINSSREMTKKFKYRESNLELVKALENDSDKLFEIEILILIAKNYEALDEFNLALKHYRKAQDIALIQNDSRRIEIEFLIAMIDKNQFRIEEAKEKFKFIISNPNNPKIIIAKSYLELGELEEANSNITIASKYYNCVLSILLGKDKELVCKAYYKLAVLYDENQDYDKAIEYYKKNYKTSSEKKENKYYSVSLTNLASIYSELEEYNQAIEYYKLALIYDSEENDLENMYFSQKELAKLYSREDEITSIGYYKQALDSAKKLNDTFKEALVHFEMGEFFYDRQENEKALVNLYNAKMILNKISDYENIERVELRINDIKIKMDEAQFKLISERYNEQ